MLSWVIGIGVALRTRSILVSVRASLKMEGIEGVYHTEEVCRK